MSPAYNDRDVASRYDSARVLPKGTYELWMDTLKEWLPHRVCHRVLDIGCGTGRFVQALQTTFRCTVVAVDPSEAMLSQRKTRENDHTHWVRGAAEYIPLKERAVDLVWMCQVYHHLRDRMRVIQQIHSALSPSGCLVVRNSTRETEQEIEWSKCFPETRQMDQIRLPARKDLIDLVCNHGFRLSKQETIYQFFASSYQEYYEKIAQRGLSSLIMINDAAFAAGLERLKQWVAEQPRDQPVHEPVDLFVFQRMN